MRFDDWPARFIPAISGIASVLASLFLIFEPFLISPPQYVLGGTISIFAGVMLVHGAGTLWPAIVSFIGFGFYMIARGIGIFEHQYLRYAIGATLFTFGFFLLMRAFTPSRPVQDQ